jgi:uncharacterized protein (DUF1330 family)
MAGYIALLIDISDHAAFSGYARAAAPTYATYGGNIVLRGPIVGLLEGDLAVQPDTRLVVLEFPSIADARAWWESEEYRPLVALRSPPVAQTRAFLIDGITLA